MLKALDLARRVEAGELTPSKIIELAAENIAKRESEVGAFATLALEYARKAAQDVMLAKKPLRGLPFGLKDIYDTADMPTVVPLIDPATGKPIPGKTITVQDCMLAMLAVIRWRQTERDAAEGV